MESYAWTRRIDVFALTLVAGGGAAVAILHREAGHNVAAPVLAKKPVAPTVSQPAPQSEQPQAQPSIGAPDDASVFASIAEREVSQLHEGSTLAKWLDARGKPDDWEKTPERETTPTDQPGPECLSYMKGDTLPSGTRIVRVLYFYPPPVPSPAIFPTLSSQDLINTCVAAMVEVDAEATTPEGDHALDQAARLRLTKQYGESIGMKDVPFWGRSYDRDADRWIDPNNNEIVAGYKSQVLDVFVHARMPLAQGSHLNAVNPYRHLSMEPAQFRRAVAAAGLDAALSQRMQKLYAVDTTLAESLEKRAEEICKTHCLPEELPEPTGDNWRAPLLPILQDWFKALETAQPAERAAGLYAADRMLMAFAGIRPWKHFGGEKSGTEAENKLRSGLEGLGAVFAMSPDEDSYYYTGNWIREARNVAPDSEGGRLALLEWMSTGECEQAGEEAFRKIIAEGEALLTKKIDAATAAQVHFMLGDAYSDIVAIAGGESGGNGDYTGDYEKEADSAHAKALKHYRAGLAIDNTSENAGQAWSQAWQLAAGLLPSERYVCFGD